MTDLTIVDRLRLFLASGFGSGYSPIAPGTAGTVAAALLVLLLARTPLPACFTLIALTALSTLGSFLLGAPVERIVGTKDPGLFVLDEFAGFYLALLTLKDEWPAPREILVAFLLFRVFDILKPFPARRLQELGGGTGIVLDDLVAGLYALVGVAVFRKVMQNPPW